MPTEWYWVTKMALTDLICEAFQCTPSEAQMQDPRVVLPIIELRALRRAKDMHNQEGGMKEFAKQPFMVALWKEMLDAAEEN